MAVPILARTISYLDSAGEAVVVVKSPGLEGEGLSRALGVVRMVHHQCHQLRVGMVRVCVAGSKVTIGLIGGVGEKTVGAREDLVVGVAHGGMDQVVEWAVGVDVTELFTFYDLLWVVPSSLVYARFTKETLTGFIIDIRIKQEIISDSRVTDLLEYSTKNVTRTQVWDPNILYLSPKYHLV